MGKALALVAEQLKMPLMPDRSLFPVLVLISDGKLTDDFMGGLKSLMDKPWDRKAIRIAIPIGEDVNLDAIPKFISNSEIMPSLPIT